MTIEKWKECCLIRHLLKEVTSDWKVGDERIELAFECLDSGMGRNEEISKEARALMEHLYAAMMFKVYFDGKYLDGHEEEADYLLDHLIEYFPNDIIAYLHDFYCRGEEWNKEEEECLKSLDLI